jgi:two-component system chemotaxis response regulator CheB
MISAPATPSSSSSAAQRLRVMIVDDSAVVRGLVSRWLNEHAGMEVVATAANGRIALEALDSTDPDVILLDLDMPELDGLSALPLILRQKPKVAVLIASTLTKRNAEISLRCLSLGAVDYLPKPDNNREITTSQSFRKELVLKLDAIASLRRRRQEASHIPASALVPAARTPAPSASPGLDRFNARALPDAVAALPPVPARVGLAVAPRCLLIGASTGGPRAIAHVLANAANLLPHLPVLIVQHMPPVFTAVFAEHLRVQTGCPAREPFDGERLAAGTIYVAPGGRHFGLRRVNGHPTARLDDGPPINFCRPAVDVLFRDAAEIFGASALAVVLTGMGSDGTQGARELTKAGATLIVQDEPTSTVWGMPGSIVKAGLKAKVLPLGEIGGTLQELAAGVRR